MAKFRVMYKSTDYVYLDVEADSLEEAKEIAKIQMVENLLKMELVIGSTTTQKMKTEM